MSFFGLFRPSPAPDFFLLDLHMEKVLIPSQNQVRIAVLWEPGKNESKEDAQFRKELGEKICRELRAYLLIGS